MSDTNGSGGLIRRTLQPLVAEDERLAGEEETISAALAKVKAERKIIGRLLLSGGLIEKPEPKASTKPKPKYVSAKMLERARDFLPDGEFTVRQASEAMETSELSAGNAIKALREAGEIRLVGKRVPAGTNSATKAAHYARVG